ncbi:erythromycin resistance leader peptide [Gudongella oleilytica]
MGLYSIFVIETVHYQPNEKVYGKSLVPC